MTHKTIFDEDFKFSDSDREYNYQRDLTKKLDCFSGEMDQNIINEIMLWKVNRYASVELEILALLNTIERESSIIDQEKTRIILNRLLGTKGIRLPVASTILRFINNKVYQILDQRVYRIINKDKVLDLEPCMKCNDLEGQIELYLNYLEDLKMYCLKFDIPFDVADRVFYMADKRINKEKRLNNY
jgi:hypothetical protein